MPQQHRFTCVILLVACVYVAIAKPPTVPGFDLLGRGIDMTEFSLEKPEPMMRARITNPGGLGTQWDHVTWVNPYSGAAYDVPISADLIDDTSTTFVSLMCSSFNEFLSAHQSSVGFDVGARLVTNFIPVTLVGFEGSSPEARRVSNKMKRGRSFMSYQKLTKRLYKLGMPYQQQGTSELMAAALALPAKYNEAAYAAFVKKFGTHVIWSVTMGGQATAETVFDSSITDSFTPTSVDLIMRAQFMKWSGDSKGFSLPIWPTREFIAAITSSAGGIDVIGGEAPPSKLSRKVGWWQEWLGSVHSKPVPVEYRLANITKMLPNSYTEQKLHLARYLESYYASKRSASDSTKPAENPIPLFARPVGAVSSGTCPEGSAMIGCNVWYNDEDDIEGIRNLSGESLTPWRCASLHFSFAGLMRSQSSLTEQIEQSASSNRVKKAKVGTARPAGKCLWEETYLTQRPSCSDYADHACLPGITQLGTGYDILTGELRTMPVLDTSDFDMGRTAAITLPSGKILKFSVPDTVNFGFSVSSSTHTKQVRNAQDFPLAMEHHVTAFPKINFILQYSKESTTINHMMSGYQSSAVLSDTTHQIFWAGIPSNLYRPRATFASAVADLPEVYDSTTRAQYEYFVYLYGSHVVVNATFGGRKSSLSAVDQDYSSSHTSFDVERKVGVDVPIPLEEFGLPITAHVSTGAHHSNHWDTRDSQTRDSTATYWSYHGGDYIGDDEKWRKSIPCDPTRLKVTVVQLDEFIGDQVRKQNMRKFLAEYTSRPSPITSSMPVGLTPKFVNKRSTTRVCTGTTAVSAGVAKTFKFNNMYVVTEYHTLTGLKGPLMCGQPQWKDQYGLTPPQTGEIVQFVPQSCPKPYGKPYRLKEHTSFTCPTDHFITGFERISSQKDAAGVMRDSFYCAKFGYKPRQ